MSTTNTDRGPPRLTLRVNRDNNINQDHSTSPLLSLELNDTIRKSGYHFTVEDDRYLKLFPIPTRTYKLWFEYQLKSVANAPVKDTSTSLITDVSNVPYSNPTYAYINEPGRQWIRRYALALAKEMLGSVRGKYQVVPIPGDTTTLDYNRLLLEAKAILGRRLP